MNWATHAIQKLGEGETVQLRPRGHSMSGRIESGNLVTIEPRRSDLSVNDIVLVKVNGTVYLHLIKAIKQDNVLIGNNRGGTNGWTKMKNVYGKVTKVEND